MKNPAYRLSAFILVFMIMSGAQLALAQDDESGTTRETIDIKVYEGLMPFAQFSYMDIFEIEEQVLANQETVFGRAVNLSPREGIEGVNYFEITILLIRSYKSQGDVAEEYIGLLGNFLEEDFPWHTISGFVSADGAYQSLGGQGFVSWGEVVAEHPLKGVTFSQEFRNYTLPGNVDLRVIFKYPTEFEDAELMRRCFITALSTLKVHSDEFGTYEDTDLSSLRE